MGEYLWLPVLLVIFAVIAWSGVLTKRGLALFWRRVSGQERREAEARAALHARYRNPRWDFYEIHLGRAAPAPLRRLYAEPDLALRPRVRVADQEIHLHPIDDGQLIRVPTVATEVLLIAETEAGEPVYLKPQGERHQSAVLFFRDLDEEPVLFEDVERFVSAIEEGRRAADPGPPGR